MQKTSLPLCWPGPSSPLSASSHCHLESTRYGACVPCALWTRPNVPVLKIAVHLVSFVGTCFQISRTLNNISKFVIFSDLIKFYLNISTRKIKPRIGRICIYKLCVYGSVCVYIVAFLSALKYKISLDFPPTYYLERTVNKEELNNSVSMLADRQTLRVSGGSMYFKFQLTLFPHEHAES